MSIPDSLFDPATLSTAAATEPALPRIVLIGAGHAHLQVVERWRREPVPFVELILVTAFDRAAYCGLLPAMFAGLAERQAGLIDLRTLTARSRVRLIVDRAIRLDPVSRTIELAHQPSLRFDVASINIGSVTQNEAFCQRHRMLVSVKPLATFLDRWESRFQELAAQHAAAPTPEGLRFVVVGAGTAGVEMALALERYLARRKCPGKITLYDGAKELLAGHSPRAVQLLRRELARRDICIELGRRIVGCQDDGPTALILDDGTHERCDLAIWATGAAPPDVLRQYDLPKSDRGFLQVRSTYQTVADAPVFVVGDTADPIGRWIPKAGVYAVQQAAVLWPNLSRGLRGERLVADQPQHPSLSFISGSDGTAVVEYGRYALRSRWAWWLKQRMDRKFVERLR